MTENRFEIDNVVQFEDGADGIRRRTHLRSSASSCRSARASVARPRRRDLPGVPTRALSVVFMICLAVPLLRMLFGLVSAVGGILIAIGSTLPISPFITTICFAIYLVCRIVAAVRIEADATHGAAGGDRPLMPLLVAMPGLVVSPQGGARGPVGRSHRDLGQRRDPLASRRRSRLLAIPRTEAGLVRAQSAFVNVNIGSLHLLPHCLDVLAWLHAALRQTLP